MRKMTQGICCALAGLALVTGGCGKKSESPSGAAQEAANKTSALPQNEIDITLKKIEEAKKTEDYAAAKSYIEIGLQIPDLTEAQKKKLETLLEEVEKKLEQ